MLFGPQMQNQSFFGGGMPQQQPQMMPFNPAPVQGPPGLMPRTQMPQFMPPGSIQGLQGDQNANPLASILGNQGGAMGPGMNIDGLVKLIQKLRDQQSIGGNLSNGNNLPPGAMNMTGAMPSGAFNAGAQQPDFIHRLLGMLSGAGG